MKKINLNFKKPNLKELDLVKGCPPDTDFNHNGVDDDDFNGDGEYNSLDEAYWEGYDDGYNDDDNMIDMEGYSEANPDSPYIEHDNPYEPGTIEHLMWEGGHREGSRDCEGGY